MPLRLRDVVVAQHRRLLGFIDRAESALTLQSINRLRIAMTEHLHAEEKLILPITANTTHGSRYGGEEHAVLRFALERVCEKTATRYQREARLRVLRDLLVHHVERDEHLTLDTIETRLGESESAAFARRFRKAVGLSQIKSKSMKK